MIEKALNNQIAVEMYSSNLYLAMSMFFSSKDYDGMAAYMMEKSEEERGHALEFAAYMIKRMMNVELQAIDAPQIVFNDVLSTFVAALAHEQKVTAMINNIAHLAMEGGDNATMSFIKKFIDEQVEEEDEAFSYIQKLIKIQNDNGALCFFDHELGEKSSSKVNVELEI